MLWRRPRPFDRRELSSPRRAILTGNLGEVGVRILVLFVLVFQLGEGRRQLVQLLALRLHQGLVLQ